MQTTCSCWVRSTVHSESRAPRSLPRLLKDVEKSTSDETAYSSAPVPQSGQLNSKVRNLTCGHHRITVCGAPPTSPNCPVAGADLKRERERKRKRDLRAVHTGRYRSTETYCTLGLGQATHWVGYLVALPGPGSKSRRFAFKFSPPKICRSWAEYQEERRCLTHE